MKYRIIFSLTVLTTLFCLCVNTTENEPEDGTTAVIFGPDEKTPAASATVTIFKANDTTGRPQAIRITDENGRYSSDNLPDGDYNVTVCNDSLVLFQDSVSITGGRGLHDGTLTCPSSITGKISLQPQHDARTARIRLRGTGRSIPISDIEGSFTIDHIAGGVYTAEVTTSLAGYRPLNMRIDVPKCRDTLLADSVLRPEYTGAPVVEGVTVALDTLNQTISLGWQSISSSDFLEYLVFRDSCGGIGGTPRFLATTKNNRFIDTTFKSLPVNKRDTVGRCFQYRIAARTVQQDTGPFFSCNEVTFISRAVITTFLTHTVVNPFVPCDSASINDQIVVAITAKNRSRPLKRLVWYDPAKQDSIQSATTSGNEAPYILQDSIRYSFSQTGLRWFYAVITDQSGTRWVDTIPVRIVADIPIANAGKDTGGLPGEIILLSGSAKQKFGTISQWYWKIGEYDWSASPDGSIAVTVPPEGTSQICSLAVVDEDGNRATDAMRLYSTTKIIRVAAGGTNSLFLSSGGTLWGCGSNNQGQLSPATASSVAEPVDLGNNVRDMAICGSSSLIVKNDNTLWACGSNSSGLLANRSDIRLSTQKLVLNDVKSVATGPSSNCMILKTDGSLWACGGNAFGLLGIGSTASAFLTPVQVMTDVLTMDVGDLLSLIVKTDHTMWACGATSFFPALFGESDTAQARVVPALAMNDVRDVALGTSHIVILKTDGTCLTSGYNGMGQVGDGTTEKRTTFFLVMDDVKSIATGNDNTFFVKNDGSLWGCGRNNSGQLGSWTSGGVEVSPVQLMTDVQSVAAGTDHTIILTTSGKLWVSGNNSSGQFGDGSYLYSTLLKQSFVPRY